MVACTAIALTFEEMRTPNASGRVICVQKIRKCVPRKRNSETMTHFKSTGYRVRQTIRRTKMKWWKPCALSFHDTPLPCVIVYLVCSLRCAATEYASLLWFSVLLDCYAFIYTQKITLTRPPQAGGNTWLRLMQYSPEVNDYEIFMAWIPILEILLMICDTRTAAGAKDRHLADMRVKKWQQIWSDRKLMTE